jgi:hypothetical protein
MGRWDRKSGCNYTIMTTIWIETPRLYTGPLSQFFDEQSRRKSIQDSYKYSFATSRSPYSININIRLNWRVDTPSTCLKRKEKGPLFTVNSDGNCACDLCGHIVSVWVSNSSHRRILFSATSGLRPHSRCRVCYTLLTQLGRIDTTNPLVHMWSREVPAASFGSSLLYSCSFAPPMNHFQAPS